MASNVALMGFPGRDCYTAAKGGIAAITRSLAVAYAPQKVRVNAIAPSVTRTDRVVKLMAGNAVVAKIADAHLLGLGEPRMSRTRRCIWPRMKSKRTTGSILLVDSGVTIA